MDVIPKVELNDGHQIDALVYGTSSEEGLECVEAVGNALSLGYRAIDSAQRYNNEMSVGAAIKKSSVPRDEITVISKVHGSNQGKENTRNSVINSLRKFGLDYLDVMLIHWPNPSLGLAIETWQELISIKSEGLVKTIGVSNFSPQQLDEIVEATGVAPALNQIPIDLWAQGVGWRQACFAHDCVPMAWGPSGHRAYRFDQHVSTLEVEQVAKKHGVSTNQISLAWHHNSGHIAVAYSSKEENRKANIEAMSIELSSADMELLSSIKPADLHVKFYDPYTHEEW